jgi:perosamine synthetase
VTGAGHRAFLTDIDDALLTIDPGSIPRDAAAVIAPHAYGAPVDVEALTRLACPWIEDCATSPALGPGERRAGASGTFAVFSFGSTKYLTGGSGGMVLTDDPRLAARVDDLLDFDRFEKRGAWQHGLPAALPGRLADLNAAVALTQWRRLPDLAAHRQTIAAVYRAGLADVAGLRVPRPGMPHAFYRYLVRTDAPAEPLAVALRARGIDARSSVNPWLDAAANVTGGPWPVAARWRDHLLSLPIHPHLSEADAHRVVATLKEVLPA